MLLLTGKFAKLDRSALRSILRYAFAPIHSAKLRPQSARNHSRYRRWLLVSFFSGGFAGLFFATKSIPARVTKNTGLPPDSAFPARSVISPSATSSRHSGKSSLPSPVTKWFRYCRPAPYWSSPRLCCSMCSLLFISFSPLFSPRHNPLVKPTVRLRRPSAYRWR